MAVATTNEPNSGGLPASTVNPEVNKQPDSNQKQAEVNKPTTNLTLADITNPTALYNGLRDLFNQGSVRKAIPVVIGVALILILASFYSSMNPELTQPLFPGMQESDRQAAIEKLKEGGFSPKIDKNTGQVLVEQSDYHEARIFLSSQGIPQKPMVSGFESLKDESSMTTSQFMEQAKYMNALEQELALSVGAISSVESARVHLALPKDSVFIREKKPATASVVVTPFAGMQVNIAQVQAIVHLVSSSIPNLAPGDVTVVDNYGNLLTENNLDPSMGLTAKQMSHKNKAEETYRNRIIQLLAPVVGRQNVRSQVNIDMNFTEIESTFEDFDANRHGPKTRSEVLAEDRTYRPDPSGIPGAYSNTPPPDARLEADGIATAEEPPALSETISSRTTRNYELDRIVRHVKNPTGNIDRITVAVVINEKIPSNKEEENLIGGYTQNELNNLNKLIQGAIGFDENRGDEVTIVPAMFEVPPDPKDIPWFENDDVINLIKLAVIALLFLSILLTIVRPVVKSFIGPVDDSKSNNELGDLTKDKDSEEDEDKDSEEDEDKDSEEDEDKDSEEDEDKDSEEDEDKDSDEDDDEIEFEEGETLEDIKAKLKPKKSTISLDMLDTANSYDDKVAIIRMLVSEDSTRVANVLKRMIDD